LRSLWFGPRHKDIIVQLLRTVAALVLGYLTVAPAPAKPESYPEYRIKAAFLINFARFVEFPNSQNNSADPFTFCVLGRDPFGALLDQAAGGKTVHGRRLQILRIGRRELASCQALFIATSEVSRLSEILTALGGRSVLTVGEAKGFALRGGIINFFIEGEKVRFEINPSTAARAGLKISSELLQVATIVEIKAEVR
jgi:hypothetical protein